MINEKNLKEIGKKECIKMLGFYNMSQYSEYCCDFYGWNEDYYEYGIGMDEHENTKETIGGECPFKYRAMVRINPNSGEVIRDLENSILPIQQ